MQLSRSTAHRSPLRRTAGPYILALCAHRGVTQCRAYFRDRDRGAPHDVAPPTPPGIRVTYLGGSIGLGFSMCSRAFGFRHRQERFGRSAAVRS